VGVAALDGSPKVERLSFGDVDAESLYQPRRPKLPRERKRMLEAAKGGLRELFGRKG
jgi:hypothetical protein